ncbi:MAG TPA: DUF3971 domain-containing protein, partial [Gammaproteobacteria bacterium]|nr:DUF3971 domain-containing protein [Gammaproteobacteria bacterium]
MKPLLWRGAELIGLFAVILIVAVAAVRLAAPLLAGQRETIETLVSMTIGRPVSIGAIAAEWHGLSPHLILCDVEVLDDDRKPALGFKVAYATLDVTGTLFSRHLKLRELDLVGANIHLVRETSGRISVRGVTLRPRAGLKDLNDFVLTLSASRVRWEDHRLDVDYQFSGVKAAFNIQSEQHHLAAVLNLPPELGGHLRAAADLQGTLGEPATWQGSAYLKANAVQVANLPEALRTYLAGGQTTGEVWSDWQDGTVVNSLGNVSVKHASLADPRTLAHTSDIDHLRTRFLWQTRSQGWALQLTNLALSRAGRHWVSDTDSFRYRPRPKGKGFFSGAFSYARVEDLVALLLRTGKVDAGFAAKLAERSPAGELADVQFNAHLQNGHIKNYAAKGNFRGLSLNPTAEMPGFTGADGRFTLNQAAGVVDLTTRNLEIVHPRLFANRLPINYLQGGLSWRREAHVTLVDAPALAFGNEDVKAQGRIALRLEASSPHLIMRLSLSEGKVAHAARYLPVKAMRSETYEWLKRALVAGRLTEGDVAFNGDIADF